MKKRCLASVVLLVAVAASGLPADNKKETAKSVLKKLEGTWKMEAMEVNGMENAQADRMGAVIEGNVITLTRDGKESATAKLVLNPGKEPATVDWKWTSGSVRGHTSLGIYRLKDNKLEICMNQARGRGSDKRPSKFTTKPAVGKGSILYVLVKKEK